MDGATTQSVHVNARQSQAGGGATRTGHHGRSSTPLPRRHRADRRIEIRAHFQASRSGSERAEDEDGEGIVREG